MRPKAKTNLEKMGFIDSDRNKAHDELQLEILSNPEKLIRSITNTEILDLKIESIKLEVPVMSGTFIVGFIDCVIVFSFQTEKESYKTIKKLVVEIKTSINSFGDTLRQINTYKKYDKYPNTFLTDAVFVIACPDDSLSEQFKTQGIRFYNFK